MTPSDPIDTTPDLTLAECGERWGVSSRNSVKARAAALGVELRRESSTRTVWPAQYVALGDQLAEHLRAGGTLASFGGSLPSAAAGSDGAGEVSVMAPAAGSDRPRRKAAALSVPSAGAGSDAMVAFAQLAELLTAPRPQADPLAVARRLAEAADLGVGLSSAELAEVLGLTAGTVARWQDGHRLRDGIRLVRTKVGDNVWWRVVRDDSPISDGSG